MKLFFIKDIIKSGIKCKEFIGHKTYIDTGSVNEDLIISGESVTFDKKPSRANICVEVGDVLFAKMRNSVKVIEIDDSNSGYIYSTGFYCFKDKRIFPSYFKYVLLSPNFNKVKDEKCFGATMSAINDDNLEKISIDIPSYETQMMISSELDALSDLIKLKKKQLQLYEELITSVFVELFGNPITNSLGLPVSAIRELGYLSRGTSRYRPRNSPELLDGKYPLIQTSEVSSADLFIKSYKNTYSEIGLKQSKMWKKGTLCITIAANIAKTGILDFDACFPDSVVGFVPNNYVNNIYMHYWFSFFQKILEAQAPETAQKNINIRILNELKVILPPKSELDKFSEFVFLIEDLKKVLSKQIEGYVEIQRNKMNEYIKVEVC